MRRFLRAYSCGDEVLARERLRAWYRTELGRRLLADEQVVLESVLPGLFGYHLLQVGAPWEDDLLSSSRIRHRMVVEGLTNDSSAPGTFRADPWALPIASGSLDVLVLPHTLEFQRDPHQVLREAERTLIPEGHVVILCFNPGSLWGLRRLFRGWRHPPPWCGHFLTLTRVKDWLALLGFDTVLARGYFFRPPIHHPGVMERLQFLENTGRRWWPLLGAGYLCVAKKRVVAMTPLRPRWRRRLAGRLEPTLNGHGRRLHERTRGSR